MTMKTTQATSKATTKSSLIESVYQKFDFTKEEASEIVEVVFTIMKDTLETGERLKISGFGNFGVREKHSRMGRNPRTGEKIEITPRRVLTFKPSNVLKKRLNG